MNLEKIMFAILDSVWTYVILAAAVWLAPRFFDKFFPRTVDQQGQKERS